MVGCCCVGFVALPIGGSEKTKSSWRQLIRGIRQTGTCMRSAATVEHNATGRVATSGHKNYTE